ncbi:MAG: DUF177 domain-containing protein [Anaerolineales bacterium]|nr:DUF177 domain-containing protein [Anaerolineales bacterium]
MSSPPTKLANRVLRLNVGFVLKEGIGYSRDFPFDEAAVTVADDLTVSDLRGNVNLTRTPQGLYAQGLLRAKVAQSCARCLADMQQPVTSRLGELYHYPPESAPPDSLTVGDDHYLDLTPTVREEFLLSIPMQPLCRPDCRGLCPQCGANWNDGPCDCPAEDRDPRWSGLLDLLDPDKEPPAN